MPPKNENGFKRKVYVTKWVLTILVAIAGFIGTVLGFGIKIGVREHRFETAEALGKTNQGEIKTLKTALDTQLSLIRDIKENQKVIAITQGIDLKNLK